jgi:site-specific DNA recombinase
MTKRAVLYARVSGDDRKYATSGIESQLADCRRYAAERGYQVVGEVNETPDRATSGADWLPELDRVLKLAQGGGFEVLVVREIDRLARNRFKQMAIEIQLEECGARVEYVIGQFEETAEGRLLKGLMSEFAEYEREKIRERTVRGIIRAVEAGNVVVGGSRAPYGYDLATVDGRRTLVVNDEEAAIVHLIYELYIREGYSMHAIAGFLTEQGIPKPGKGLNHRATSRDGTPWEAATVRNILSNETYVGRWHYRKTRTRKAAGGLQCDDRPREEWLLVSVAAILDEATFVKAAEQRAANRVQAGKQHRRLYLLGGMIHCGHCGYSATGVTRKTRAYYLCGARHRSKRYSVGCDNGYTYIADHADAAVWHWVKGLLLDSDRLADALVQHRERQRDAVRPMLQAIEAAEKRLVGLEEERARLIRAYAAGVLSLEDLSTDKAAVELRAAELTRAIAGMRAETEPRLLTQDAIDSVMEYARYIGQGADDADSDQGLQRRILKLLRFRGRLLHIDGQRFIDVQCILGEERLSTEWYAPERGTAGR